MDMGKFEEEVLALPMEQYCRILAYMQIRSEEQKRVNSGSKIRPAYGSNKDVAQRLGVK
jgi:hypothetical protein